MTNREHTTQRDRVAASMNRPTYADRCAVPRRPMTPREAAAAFVNVAASVGIPLSTPANFNVNHRTTY